MNDFDLESRLKGVPVPERPDEYWNDFPTRIRVQLHRQRAVTTRRRPWRPLLIWSADFALAAALVFVCIECHPLQAVSAVISRQQASLRHQLARLDSGLHKLVLNTDGMGYLLAEAN